MAERKRRWRGCFWRVGNPPLPEFVGDGVIRELGYAGSESERVEDAGCSGVVLRVECGGRSQAQDDSEKLEADPPFFDGLLLEWAGFHFKRQLGADAFEVSLKGAGSGEGCLDVG